MGPSRVIACSTALWAVALMLTGRVSSLWQLYLVFGVVGGIGTGGLAYVATNALIARWFRRYRGIATGICHAGVPLGTAIAGPLAQAGITALGWRWTYGLFGGAVAATALPLVLIFFRDDPRKLGLESDGIAAGSAATAGSRPDAPPAAFTEPGLPRGYWAMFVANIFRGMGMYALMVHQVAYLVDVGFSKMAAAAFLSMISLVAVPGGLMAGALSDRVGRPKTYGLVAGFYVVGYVSLVLIRDPGATVLLWTFIVASGLATGGVGSVFSAFLTDRLHGPRAGFLLGLQNIGFGAGTTVGPILAGAMFDWRRSYTLVFLLMALAMVVSALIVSTTAHRSAPRT
jgi:MFS family permease